MRTLSFSTMKDKILVSKFCSIRPKRKRPYQIGELVKLYWKQRTKNNEVLGYVSITEVVPIQFWYLSPCQLIDLAQEDGFDSKQEMLMFFRKKYGPEFWMMPFEINRFNKMQDAKRIKELDSQGLLKGIMTARRSHA